MFSKLVLVLYFEELLGPQEIENEVINRSHRVDLLSYLGIGCGSTYLSGILSASQVQTIEIAFRCPLYPAKAQ